MDDTHILLFIVVVLDPIAVHEGLLKTGIRPPLDSMQAEGFYRISVTTTNKRHLPGSPFSLRVEPARRASVGGAEQEGEFDKSGEDVEKANEVGPSSRGHLLTTRASLLSFVASKACAVSRTEPQPQSAHLSPIFAAALWISYPCLPLPLPESPYPPFNRLMATIQAPPPDSSLCLSSPLLASSSSFNQFFAFLDVRTFRDQDSLQ